MLTFGVGLVLGAAIGIMNAGLMAARRNVNLGEAISALRTMIGIFDTIDDGEVPRFEVEKCRRVLATIEEDEGFQ